MKAFHAFEKINLNATGNTFAGVLDIAVIDTFLICSDYRNPKILEVFGQRSLKPIKQIINRGKEKGECLTVANILPLNKNEFFIYDITLAKFVKVHLDQALKATDYRPEYEFTLNKSCKGVKSPIIVNDSTFASCTYLLDDARLITFNPASLITKKIGVLPPALETWPEKNPDNTFGIKAMAYSANLKKHPIENWYVVAYNTTDRLEIYKDDILTKVIRGPGLFDPDCKVKTLNKNLFLLSPYNKTLFSHVQISTTSKYIYSLYSGKSGYKTFSDQILVWDWNGKPVKVIKLDKAINCFFVAESKYENTIYGISKDNGELLFEKIND